jgi:hypothetical protein
MHLQKVLEVMSMNVDTGLNRFNFIQFNSGTALTLYGKMLGPLYALLQARYFFLCQLEQ